jgi:hypothetical protein
MDDYTETDGWNMAFDTPFDGQGLANLYGGNDKLAKKLDDFFAAAPSSNTSIHEMVEARDVRMGQLGLNNEPAFHIPYMYDFTGQPSKTQAKVRDALQRLYVGSNIGQGYLGDDDNGSLSAWQIFGALGFYPLTGTGNYVIGSPLFKKATVYLRNGKAIVVNAPNNSDKNIYIQGLKVNGAVSNATWLSHDQLLNGAVLDFDLGPTPSTWGSTADALPPSITMGTSPPKPLRDVTGGTAGTATGTGAADLSPLFDNSSQTEITFTVAAPSIQYDFAGGTQRTVSFYTLTTGKSSTAAYPTGWILNGSNDGTTWTQVDKRDNQVFKWNPQTRAFRIATPVAYSHYQLVVTASSGPLPTLSEIELLAKP